MNKSSLGAYASEVQVAAVRAGWVVWMVAVGWIVLPFGIATLLPPVFGNLFGGLCSLSSSAPAFHFSMAPLPLMQRQIVWFDHSVTAQVPPAIF